MRFSVSVILVSTLFAAVSVPAGATVYVNAAASGANNGASWANAYTNLSAALTATSTGEIWVARGTYRPAAANGNRDLSFNLKSGVALYGGFAGNETTLAQRNPATNLTVLSGDLNDDDAVLAQTEQDLSGWLLNAGFIPDSYFENSHHVIRADNVDTSSVLDGFRIVGGRAIDPAITDAGRGAGLYLLNSSPRIVNCVIVNNLAIHGGGVYSSGGSPVFQSSELRSNFAYRGMGGALYATSVGGNTIDISDSKFIYNNAKQGGSSTGHGGAIFNNGASTLNVTRSTFNGNASWHNNSFGLRTAGGAIANLGPAIDVTYSKFVDNYANLGGAIYTLTGGTVTNSLFAGNKAWAASACGSFDCPGDVIPDPASGYGGALYASSDTTVTNVTMSNNYASRRGGGIGASLATLNVHNSILWGNKIDPVWSGEDPIPLIRAQVYGGTVNYRYSDVQGLNELIVNNPNNFPGSLDQDPLFVDGIGRFRVPADLHVRAGSPAIDAGENALVPNGVVIDLDGQPRFVDNLASPNTGLGTVPVDMGAYEVAGLGAPVVSGFWPASGPVGSFVFVFGSNFSPLGTDIGVNGVPSPVKQVVDSTMLFFLIPPGNTNGPITVTTAGGSGSSSNIFGTVLTGLQITGFWPGQASSTNFVFVFGSGFVSAATQVSMNGVNARLVHVLDPNLLLFLPPSGIGSGPITVKTGTGSVTSTENLIIR